MDSFRFAASSSSCPHVVWLVAPVSVFPRETVWRLHVQVPTNARSFAAVWWCLWSSCWWFMPTSAWATSSSLISRSIWPSTWPLWQFPCWPSASWVLLVCWRPWSLWLIYARRKQGTLIRHRQQSHPCEDEQKSCVSPGTHPVLTLRLVDKAGGSCKWPAEVARENPLTLENSTLQRVGARASHSKMYIYILSHTYTYTYIHDTVIHIYIYIHMCVPYASWSSSLIVYSYRAIYIYHGSRANPDNCPTLAPRRRFSNKKDTVPVSLCCCWQQPVSPERNIWNKWVVLG